MGGTGKGLSVQIEGIWHRLPRASRMRTRLPEGWVGINQEKGGSEVI